MESQDLYRSALETRGELLLLWGADGRVAFASQRLLDSLGLGREEVEGADLRGLNASLEARGLAGLPAFGQGGVLAAGGREFERESLPLPDGARLDSFRDVTEDREQARQREELLGVATHDLRSPLANVRSYAGLLLGSRHGADLDPRVKRSAEVIARNADRALRLLQSYFDSLRAETGELEVDHQPVPALPLLQDVVNSRRGAAQEKSVEIVSSLPPALPEVLGDKDRLAGALGALLDNSLARATGGGQVEVLAEERPGQVVVSFVDFGPPVPPTEARELFERDRQILKERRLGLGFGLAVARAIVRAHGGNVQVRSEPEQTTFEVTLPR
jgi:signal transduction histidine kinase